MADPIEDPFVAALVERAIAPYRKTLGPAELEVLRDVLLLQLAAHPTLSRYVTRLAARPDVLESGSLDTDADATENAPAAKRAKGG